MLPWLVTKIVKEQPSYTYKCHYFLIQTAATSGCMAIKPYWLYLESPDADGKHSSELYLNPMSKITDSNYYVEIKIAAIAIPGLENNIA